MSPKISPIRRFGIALGFALAILFFWKVARLILLTQAVRGELAILRPLAADPTPDGFIAAGPTLASARHDLRALRDEAQPLAWSAPLLGWLPKYGADLQSAKPLLDWGAALVSAADDTYTGLSPFMRAAWGEGAHPTPSQAIAYLVVGRAYFTRAQTALVEAAAARAQFDPDTLSPRTRDLVAKVDAQMSRLQSGLALLSEAPALLGAEAPRTYLLLLQNEDELRATGGFITAVGTVTLDHAEIAGLKIETSFQVVDDLAHVYPEPPLPLRQYMGLPRWVLRDSNWSPDFPTSAARAVTLYHVVRPAQPLAGVLALDQQAVQIFLRALGPVTLTSGETVDADNVRDYMRHVAWANVPEQGTTNEWWLHHKDFIQQMAAALLAKIGEVSWLDLGQAALAALAERHALVWFAAGAPEVLGAPGWDGALRPGPGDYLMVVDSNLGYNKVNAVIAEQAQYAINLSDPAAPVGALTLTHTNPASGDLPCQHNPDYAPLGTYSDTIQRCYWDYLRVYVPQGANLLAATPHAVPGEWLITRQPVPGVVRLEPGENGAQSFGTFFVVPYQTTLTTAFTYTLAPGAVARNGDEFTYTLRIQKQPGTRAMPIELSLQLPPGAQLIESEPEGVLEEAVWRVDLELARDWEVRVKFRAP
jgi:hypothetical protein